MLGWHARAPAANASTAVAPLLRAVAGEFAPAVAQLWHTPHGDFFAMPTERRHLICLVLRALDIDGSSAVPEAHGLARALSGEATKHLIRRFLHDAPYGLSRALKCLGELAWTKAQYASLLHLLKDKGAAKILHHTTQIDANLLVLLETLPPELRQGSIPLILGNAAQANMIAEAFSAATIHRSPTEMSAVAARWGRAETVQRLFEMAREDITPRRFASSPLDAHPLLTCLETEDALQDAGRRFRNCVGGYALRAASGEIVIYEWLGDPPAIISICPDPIWRWRIEEVRIEGNEPFPRDARPALIAVLQSLGVAFRRGGYSLSSTLDWASREPDRASIDWDGSEVFGTDE